MGRLLSVLVLIWLVIGVVASWQRGYFSDGETSCAGVTTIAVTIVAGPLNYVGVNPQVECPDLPEPSQ